MYKSHPTWVRGLKLTYQLFQVGNSTSHPTWVRGLKPGVRLHPASILLSHPTWVRGLKRVILAKGGGVFEVAPYVGAWIETSRTT